MAWRKRIDVVSCAAWCRRDVGAPGSSEVVEALLPPGTLVPVYPVAAAVATCCARRAAGAATAVRCYPSDLTDAQWAVLEPQAREVMAELTVAVGRPMVHDLRAMCDAVAYVVKNGIEWRALPVDFPPWDAVYAFFEAVERPRPAAGAGRPAAGTAAARPGPGRGADGVHHRLADRQGARHRPEGDQRLPRREEDHRPRPAHRRRHRGLAARPGRHRRLGQRQGRREAAGITPVRRVRHAEDHVGRHRLQRHAAARVRRTPPRSPSRSSRAPARTPSRSCAAAGSWSGPSAGSCATAAWPATTSAPPRTPRP